jgi:hypothetical protein
MQTKKQPLEPRQAAPAKATRTRAIRSSSAAAPVAPAASKARKAVAAKRKVAAPVAAVAASVTAKPAAPRVKAPRAKAPRGPSTEALLMKSGKGAEKDADKVDDKRIKADPVAKLVRDSFTMPEVEFAQIAALKERAIRFGRPAKKSELLRAGLKVLCGLDDATLRATLDSLAPLKPGRPRKS